VAELVGDQLRQQPLALAVEVGGGRVARPPAGPQHPVACLGMRHPRERRRRYDQVGAEHLPDLPTEGVAYAGDGVGQQLLLHAHPLLEQVPDLEDEVLSGRSEVDEPPVQPQDGIAGLGDRQRLLGGGHLLDGIDEHLDPAQLDLRGVHHPAGQGDGRPDGQSIDLLVKLGVDLATVGELDGPALVAKHDELHAPLQPQGLDPAADPHPLSHPHAQLADEHARGTVLAFLSIISPG
jgi:hypothetical protein